VRLVGVEVDAADIGSQAVVVGLFLLPEPEQFLLVFGNGGGPLGLGVGEGLIPLLHVPSCNVARKHNASSPQVMQGRVPIWRVA
jgi:hypothetical protein